MVHLILGNLQVCLCLQRPSWHGFQNLWVIEDIASIGYFLFPQKKPGEKGVFMFYMSCVKSKEGGSV